MPLVRRSGTTPGGAAATVRRLVAVVDVVATMDGLKQRVVETSLRMLTLFGVAEMDFTRRLKGELAQAVIRSILLQAQYRVVEFGVEKSVRELSSLSQDGYKAIRRNRVHSPIVAERVNNPALSQMPDFVVMDRDQTRMSLVEVKYRSALDDDRLLSKLAAQTRRFGEVVFVLLFGDGAAAGRHGPVDMSDFLRCFVLREAIDGRIDFVLSTGDTVDVKTSVKSLAMAWQAGTSLGDLFPQTAEEKLPGDFSLRRSCVTGALAAMRAIEPGNLQAIERAAS